MVSRRWTQRRVGAARAVDDWLLHGGDVLHARQAHIPDVLVLGPVAQAKRVPLHGVGGLDRRHRHRRRHVAVSFRQDRDELLVVLWSRYLRKSSLPTRVCVCVWVLAGGGG